MRRPVSSPGARTVGVVGAGRVGAVLAAALKDVPDGRYRLSAVAGESSASRMRIETLLPGVPVEKPTAVARACDVLLLTVPDDMLDNVVRMLAASGAIRPGQYIAHTSGRHGLAVLAPAVQRGASVFALHPVMTFTGTDLDRGRLAGCVFGVTAEDDARDLAEQLVIDLGGRAMWVDESRRALYHAGLAHGANHMVTLVAQAVELLGAAGAADPAATLRPLLTAALDNALDYGAAALTGPIVRGDVNTVRAHLVDIAVSAPGTVESYVVMARATANRAVLDGRLDARRATAIVEVLDDALAGVVA